MKKLPSYTIGLQLMKSSWPQALHNCCHKALHISCYHHWVWWAVLCYLSVLRVWRRSPAPPPPVRRTWWMWNFKLKLILVVTLMNTEWVAQFFHTIHLSVTEFNVISSNWRQILRQYIAIFFHLEIWNKILPNCRMLSQQFKYMISKWRPSLLHLSQTKFSQNGKISNWTAIVIIILILL